MMNWLIDSSFIWNITWNNFENWLITLSRKFVKKKQAIWKVTFGSGKMWSIFWTNIFYYLSDKAPAVFKVCLRDKTNKPECIKILLTVDVIQEMNVESSRSNLIVGIMVESRNLADGSVSTGKLSLMDLAGSERAAKTGAKDHQLKVC